MFPNTFFPGTFFADAFFPPGGAETVLIHRRNVRVQIARRQSPLVARVRWRARF